MFDLVAPRNPGNELLNPQTTSKQGNPPHNFGVITVFKGILRVQVAPYLIRSGPCQCSNRAKRRFERALASSMSCLAPARLTCPCLRALGTRKNSWVWTPICEASPTNHAFSMQPLYRALYPDMKLLADRFPSLHPPPTRGFKALSTLSLLALFHKQSGPLGLEMEPCFPCGQKPAIAQKSNRGPDQADAEPAEEPPKQKNRRHDTPRKRPVCVFLVRCLIFWPWP